MEPKTILICDDHVLFAKGLSELLSQEKFNVYTLNKSEDCKKFFETKSVDIFICDLNIDNKDGFELISELGKYLKKTKVLILSAYFETFLIEKAKNIGVQAFLKKETSLPELIEVINAPYNSPFVSNKNSLWHEKEFNKSDQNLCKKFILTRQEKEIIRLIIDGNTSIQIAEILNLSKTTIDTHRKNIHRKLEVNNTGNLIRYAHENNLLD